MRLLGNLLEGVKEEKNREKKKNIKNTPPTPVRKELFLVGGLWKKKKFQTMGGWSTGRTQGSRI